MKTFMVILGIMGATFAAMIIGIASINSSERIEIEKAKIECQQ